jgi:hypothetical protein
MNEKRDLAHHEAAHAVIGHVLGARIQHISLTEKHMLQDRRRAMRVGKARAEEFLAANIVELLAGYTAGLVEANPPGAVLTVAEVIRDRVKHYMRHGTGENPDDLEYVAQLMLLWFGSEFEQAQRCIEIAAQITEQLVREQWRLIDVVAEALREHGEVSGEEFLALLAGHAQSLARC